jgi:acyl-CoA synthetase (AMP-forming)/AMP-acid ligase II
VVGIPDGYRGETVKAFVSLRPDAFTEPQELIAYCCGRMAAYKYPGWSISSTSSRRPYREDPPA